MLTVSRIQISIFGVLLALTVAAPIYAQPTFDDETNKNSAIIRNERLSETKSENGGTSLIDLLIIDIEDKQTKRGLIEHFCETLLGKRTEGGNITDNTLYTLYRDEEAFRFDPRTSVFMYTLCVNIDEAGAGEKYNSYTYEKKDYATDVFEDISYTLGTTPTANPVPFGSFIRIEPEELNQAWGIPDQARLDADGAFHACNPRGTLQGCKFSTLLPDIFRTIMNDYTNLKQAAIMGYKRQENATGDALSEEDITLAISEFARSHFGSLDPDETNVPCNDPDIHYLAIGGVSSLSEHCFHPQTNAIVRKNIESVDRLVQNTVLLHGPELMKQKCDTKAPRNTIHACAFSSFGDEPVISDRQALYNVYLNEYMRYSMFINYYIGRQTVANTYSPITMGSMLYNYQNAQKDGTALAFERSLAKSAMQQSIRLLKNLHTRYPVTIGMEAYKEDVIRYKGQLSNLYTPFNQLNFTLQNVQSDEE